MSPLLYLLIVGWAVTSAAICGVWFYRYWREWARLRDQEARFAEEWCRTHKTHQHDRHDHADERRPE